MKNYYRLTKRELSFISSIQEPVISSDNQRLSRPVVVATSRSTCEVKHAYTLACYKHLVAFDLINETTAHVIRYDILAML